MPWAPALPRNDTPLRPRRGGDRQLAACSAQRIQEITEGSALHRIVEAGHGDRLPEDCAARLMSRTGLQQHGLTSASSAVDELCDVERLLGAAR